MASGFTSVIILDPNTQLEVGRIYYSELDNAIIITSDEGLNLISRGGSDIKLSPSNAVSFDEYRFPKNDGAPGQVLATDGNGQVSFRSFAESLDFNLEDLADVVIAPPLEDGQFLIYNASTGDWENTTVDFSATFLELKDTPDSYTGEAFKLLTVNSTEDGIVFIDQPQIAPVDSVFGRTGVIVAEKDDYAGTLVTYDNTLTGLSADTVQEAIDLVANKPVVTPVDSVFGRLGDVVAESGDYTATFVTYDNTTSGLLGVNTQAAIDEVFGVASNALQSGDNVSELTNDANYIVATEAPVQTVHGRSGDVVGELGDYNATLTTFDNTATGLLAFNVQDAIDKSYEVTFTALQPGDNITELTNNAGYITAAQIPPSDVVSVFGRSGAVAAAEGDYTLTLLGDVLIAAPDVDHTLIYNGSVFTNEPTESIPIETVFGRTGDIVSNFGDYNCDQVFYNNLASGLASNNAQGAIDELAVDSMVIDGGTY